jgi:preprotein translocase subunit YajC
MIKNTYLKCAFVILTFISFSAAAQTEEEAVKKTINNLFEGMKKGDTVLLRSAFSSSAIMQTIAKNKEGKVVVHTDPVSDFIVSVGKPHKELYDERITFDVIKIDGDLAIVWTPYKFFLDDKFLHCGVNSFQLVRSNGEWKIQYIIDTRRKENCN